MPTETELYETLLGNVSELSTEVTGLCHMISGHPLDVDDTGMKGILIGMRIKIGELEEFRQKKEAEMSRIWLGVILAVMNIVLTSIIGISIKLFFGE